MASCGVTSVNFTSTGLNMNFDSGSFLGVWAIADRGVGGMVISFKIFSTSAELSVGPGLELVPLSRGNLDSLLPTE